MQCFVAGTPVLVPLADGDQAVPPTGGLVAARICRRKSLRWAKFGGGFPRAWSWRPSPCQAGCGNKPASAAGSSTQNRL